MNIAIRVNASRSIGTGHFYRCFVLAKNLKSSENKVFFICDKLNNLFLRKLKSEKLNFFILDKNNKQQNYQQKDISQTLNILKKAKARIDLLIVDSYKIGKEWERKVKNYVKKIMVVDDLHRKHECDFFLNPNISASFKIKKMLPKDCKILIGPKYCLLNSSYKNKKIKDFKKKEYIKNVIIFMGGSDNANLTTKVLKVLSNKEFLHLNLKIVIGINNQKHASIRELANLRPHTKIYFNLKSIHALIKSSDIAISSGGSTIWEFVFFGLPSLIITQANNQIYNSKYLENMGVAKLFKPNKSNNHLKYFFKRNLLKKNFQIPYKIFKALDGKGTSRVSEVIKKNIK